MKSVYKSSCTLQQLLMFKIKLILAALSIPNYLLILKFIQSQKSKATIILSHSRSEKRCFVYEKMLLWNRFFEIRQNSTQCHIVSFSWVNPSGEKADSVLIFTDSFLLKWIRGLKSLDFSQFIMKFWNILGDLEDEGTIIPYPTH